MVIIHRKGGGLNVQGNVVSENFTLIFLRALSHSFWPGPDVEQTSSRLLMASVTARQAAASWFITLGALGSADRALAASSSLVEDTDMERRYFSMSLRLSGSWEGGGERGRGTPSHHPLYHILHVPSYQYWSLPWKPQPE